MRNKTITRKSYLVFVMCVEIRVRTSYQVIIYSNDVILSYESQMKN